MKRENDFGYNELSKRFSSDNLDDFINFFNNNNLSTIELIGGLSLFARTHYSVEQFNLAKDILKNKTLLEIYDELDKIPPFFDDLSHVSSNDIQKTLTRELSLSLVHDIAFMQKISCKELKSIYGLNYLFMFLLDIDLLNFENWLIRTQRFDFKIVFLNLLCNHIFNISINLENLDQSQVGIIQSFYALCKYGLEPNSSNVWSRESSDISLFFSSKLLSRNKFIIYLKFITNKYHGKNLKNLDNDVDLIQDLEGIKKLKYEFTEDDLIKNTGIYYSPICFYIVQSMNKNNLNRQSFLETLLNNLLNNLKTKDYYSDYDLDYAKLLGRISVELNSLVKIEKIFNKEFKELSFPYSFCKINDWQQRVTFLFYILIGIYVYKKANNIDFSTELNKFNFLRKSGCYYFDEKLNGLLKQMN